MAEYIKLNNLAEVIMGQSPKSSTYNEDGVGLPFFQGKAEFGDRNPIVKKWCSNPLKITEPNDILLSVRAPVGPTNICNGKSCIGRGLAAIRCRKNTDYLFLWYYLRSIEKHLAHKGVGSTFTAIGRDQIKNIQVPKMDYKTQRHVASILDKCESARAKRKEASRLTDEFLKSVFLEMFGDPAVNKKKYKIETIKDKCFVKGGKRLPKGHSFSQTQTKYPYLRVVDFKDYSIDLKNLKYIKEDTCKYIKRYVISKDNVYLSIAGTTGLSGIIPDSLDGANLTENAAKLVIKDKTKLNKIFLAHYLGNDYVQQLIKQNTMAVGVPKLALFRIEEIKLVLPPLAEQQKFADIVQKVEKLKEKQRESEKEIKNLFNSLMQKAFKGELVQ